MKFLSVLSAKLWGITICNKLINRYTYIKQTSDVYFYCYEHPQWLLKTFNSFKSFKVTITEILSKIQKDPTVIVKNYFAKSSFIYLQTYNIDSILNINLKYYKLNIKHTFNKHESPSHYNNYCWFSMMNWQL